MTEPELEHKAKKHATEDNVEQKVKRYWSCDNMDTTARIIGKVQRLNLLNLT